MRAIVLSAGQGRRLLPLTADLPKCLLPVRGSEALLGLQLRALAACGVREAAVVVGHGADHVESFLRSRPVPRIFTRTIYNPFYAEADNLASCWLARDAMRDDFLLLNGDTLFEEAVLRRLLASRRASVTMTIDEKASYDADDMKVALDAGGRLRAVGKDLERSRVDGESIGMLLFRDDGGPQFANQLELAMREPAGLRAFYLSAIAALTETVAVETTSIAGLWWGEVDDRADLAAVRAELARAARRSAAA